MCWWCYSPIYMGCLFFWHLLRTGIIRVSSLSSYTGWGMMVRGVSVCVQLVWTAWACSPLWLTSTSKTKTPTFAAPPLSWHDSSTTAGVDQQQKWLQLMQAFLWSGNFSADHRWSSTWGHIHQPVECEPRYLRGRIIPAAPCYIWADGQ